MLDGHMGNNPGDDMDAGCRDRAAMRRSSRTNLFFFEEPLHYTDPWGYAELCRRSTSRSRAASA